MRLDHLLSKELFSRLRSGRGLVHRRLSGAGSLMGGTLTIRHGWSLSVSTALRRVERRSGLAVPGTLLGPEGTAARSVFGTPAPVNFMPLWCGGDGWLVVA